MIKKQLIVLICISFLFAPCLSFADTNPYITGIPSTQGGGTCTTGSGDNWVNTTQNDYWATDNRVDFMEDYQTVANSGEKEICEVNWTLYAEGTNVTFHLEIWDTGETAQIGSDSTQQVVSGAAYTEYTFEFSATYPNPSGDFRIYLIRDDDDAGAAVRHAINTSDVFFGGTSYNVTTNNVLRGDDATLSIHYIQ